MASGSFSNWQLSSSDSEGDGEIKGVLLTIKKPSKRKSNSLCFDDSISEPYISLADRLKKKKLDRKSSDDDEDELPTVSVPKQAKKLEKGGVIVIDQTTESSTIVSDPAIDLTQNEIFLSNCVDRTPSSGGVANLLVVSPPKQARNPTMNDVITIEPSIESKKLVTETRRNFSQKQNNETQLKDISNAQKRTVLNPNLKTLKPDECLKYMDCLISSKLDDLFPKLDLFEEVQKDFVATCSRVDDNLPCIKWRRKTVTANGDFEDWYVEPEVLIAVSATHFFEMIQASTSVGIAEDQLSLFVESAQKQCLGLKVHLVCIGYEKFVKSLKAKKARETKKGGSESSGRKKKNSIPNVSIGDIENASVDLQIKHNIMITYTETPEEFVTLIKQVTKSVGEAPYKRLKRQDVQFMNEIPSVKINAKTGEGKRQAWKQMIQQFHNVTTVMATAIVDRYPSVVSLIKAYRECGPDVAKAELLLAEIPVRRGVGTLQTSRRIGPELSYKMYRQFTSVEPSESLY